MRCGRRALRRKSSIEGRLLAPAGGRVRRSRWDRSEQVWLPVVDRPDIACSVDLGCGLVHHRREARRLVGSVQRVAVRKQYLAAGGGHRVAARWRDRVAGLRPRGAGGLVDPAELRDSATAEVIRHVKRAEVRHPQVVLPIHRHVPRSVDAATLELPDDRAVWPDAVYRVLLQGGNPGVRVESRQRGP